MIFLSFFLVQLTESGEGPCACRWSRFAGSSLVNLKDDAEKSMMAWRAVNGLTLLSQFAVMKFESADRCRSPSSIFLAASINQPFVFPTSKIRWRWLRYGVME